MADDKNSKPKQVAVVVQKSFVELLQAGTGLVVSSRQDLVKDFSHVLQQATKGKLLSGLGEAYDDLKSRGKIKGDYETTDQCRQELPYIFNALDDQTVIDETRFEAVKNIFLNAAQEELSDRDSQLPLEMMRIASGLHRGEILVLEACYRYNQAHMALVNKDLASRNIKYNDAHTWLQLIAEASGLGIPDLIQTYEKSLQNKGLLSPRTAGGNIVVDTNYHLSGTGLKLCAFMTDKVEAVQI